jgi:alpha-N-arabinofuranosidase
MICLNAGNGSAEEAAKWVEYCNGSTDTEMGALRAEHGHPEPFDVEYWEVGNEIYGEWQITWTTPDGNADRYERFRAAMTDVDDEIEVMACGNRLNDWNGPVIDTLEQGDWLTDHVLVEAHSDAETDPVELFNAHTGFAAQLGAEYRDVGRQCEDAGVDPRVAITELQLFTRFDESDESPADPSLSRETLPSSQSVTEAVFDTSVVNQSIRDGVVEMITHSGVGNHGGGVQKQRERVWADPCLYAQGMGLALAGGWPVGVDVTCGTFSTETTWGEDTSPWFGQLDPVSDEPIVDAVAVSDADDHDFAAMVAHRDAGTGDVTVEIDGGGLLAEVDTVEVTTLTAETMYAENTLESPERITPTTERVAVEDDALTLTLPQYAVLTITAD